MTAPQRLPSGLSGRDLAGRAVRLPEDVPRPRTVVLAGFTEPQQTDLDAWAAALRAAEVPPQTVVLEVVLIPAAFERRRRIIEGGMAVFLRDAQVRARTWCVYGDLDGFLAALGVPDQTQVLVWVLDPDGTVHAAAAGPPSEPAVRDIVEALDR